MKPKFYLKLFQDRRKQWRVRLKSLNGNIIMSSEAYSSKSKCLKTAENFQIFVSQNRVLPIDW